MISFLKLIRLKNLFIIALTMYAMRWGVIHPMLEAFNATVYGQPLMVGSMPKEGTMEDLKNAGNFSFIISNPHVLKLQMSEMAFFLLVLSVVLLAAGGYVINDYFDIKIDRVNKPGQQIVDKTIKRRWAMLWHQTLTFTGTALGIFLSWRFGIFILGIMLFGMTATALWFYSTDFKRKFLSGNLIIAVLTGLVPLIVGVFEISLLQKKYSSFAENHIFDFIKIFFFVLAFSFFAFITTLIREILKDIVDKEGDEQYGCRTMPVILGIEKTSYIASLITLIAMCIIAYIQYLQFKSEDFISFTYITALIQLPFAVLLWKTLKGKSPADFRAPETLSKIIMVTGVLYTSINFYYYCI